MVVARCRHVSWISVFTRRIHLDRTADAMRNDDILTASVTSVKQLSPTVTGVDLVVADKKGTSFKAGQWMDTFIPEVDTVGGFSIHSPPHLFDETGELQLAVKFAFHPPAKWFCSTCRPGDSIKLRFGGDFSFSPQECPKPLLLLAGGVGINPIKSIMEETLWTDPLRHVHLLYSARVPEELLFKDTFDDLGKKHPEFHFETFVSSGEQKAPITRPILASVLKSFDVSSLRCFICGPPPMIDHFSNLVIDCGVPDSSVFFEKWW